MRQISLFRLLLSPSLLSGMTVGIGSFVILAYSAWLYLSENQVLYDYLFGPYGLKTFIWQNSFGFTSWVYGFLASPAAYYILLVGFALIVGLAVFTLLQFLSTIFRGTTNFLRSAEDAAQPSTLLELFLTLCVRGLSIVGWAAYGAYFVSSILPFTIVLNQIGVDAIRNGEVSGIASCLGAYLLLTVALHLHVVFVRLVLLRPRVFGNVEAVEAELE